MNLFPYPVNFVLKKTEKWPELFSKSLDPLPDPGLLRDRIQSNEDCWIVTTYLYLKRKGLNVSISPSFIPYQINVVSSLDFGIRDRTFNSFVVGCRSDGFSPSLCDFVIVQNASQVDSDTTYFMPHWPQPGIISRNKERGTRIENIAFKGARANLFESFRSPDFKQKLDNIGVSFNISCKPDDGPVVWHDYSNDDLILAVRDATEEDLKVKPASKLVNAWLAGVPALLGPEPAFQYFKESDLDYIEVRKPDEVIEAIKKLKQNPKMYNQMIVNGLKRAENLTPEKMTDKWCDLLSGPVAYHFEEWRNQGMFKHLVDFSLRIPRHYKSMNNARYHCHHGYHVISGQYT